MEWDSKYEHVMTYEGIIQEIIDIMRSPGEEKTDGECLEGIAIILEQHGWTVYPEGYES